MQLFATDLEKLAFLLEAEADLALAQGGLAAFGTDLVTEEAPEGKRPKYVTNYIGSKQKLVDWIWKHTPENAQSVVDAFCGSSVVAYMYKTKGLKSYKEAAAEAKAMVDAIPRDKWTTWHFKAPKGWRQPGYTPDAEWGVRRHSGGPVPGSGDVPITAQGGEYVIRRQQAMANADLVRAINNGSGPVSGGGGVRIDVGGVTVQQASNPVAAGYNVIDALAEAAYRQVVR